MYLSMTGARETMLSQAATSHNLANANTTGFRASLNDFVTMSVNGDGHSSRAYAQLRAQHVDLTPGAMQPTGRELDVAVEGQGWIAVQAPDGGEAYTRAGDLQVDSMGRLLTGSGLQVVGDGGPIAVPPYDTIEIATDGTVTIRPQGQEANALAVVDRIRLVNPPADALRRGEDGLVRVAGDAPVDADPEVRLASGMLEGSNVNVIDAMVNMIQLSRQFETQVNMIRSAEDNDQASAQLMRIT